MPIDDPQQRRADTTRAETELGWKSRWSVQQGILEMTRYVFIHLLRNCISHPVYGCGEPNIGCNEDVRVSDSSEQVG